MLILVTTAACVVCRNRSSLFVDEDGFEAYMFGANVQDALPNLDVDDRELLISGTHPDCWVEIYGEER